MDFIKCDTKNANTSALATTLKRYLPPCDIYLVDDSNEIVQSIKSISRNAHQTKANDLNIEIDTEWEQDAKVDPSLPLGVYAGKVHKDVSYKKWTNTIQSYQLTVNNPRSRPESIHVRQCTITPHKISEDGTPIPEEKRRVTLKGLLMVAMHLGGLTKQQMAVRTTRGKRTKPLNITIGGHWNSAEIAALRDRKPIFNRKEVVILGGAVVTLDPIKTSIPLDWKNEHNKPVTFSLRDSHTLMDKDSSRKLSDLGVILGRPKDKLDNAEIQNISRLLYGTEEELKRFLKYGITDTEIPLLWKFFMADIASNVLGLSREIPMTTGTLATSKLSNYYPDLQERFGLFYHKPKDMRGEWTPIKERDDHESFVQQCFYGGMNQTFHLWRQEGIIIDIDIDSAYPSTYPLLPRIDWLKPPDTSSKDPDDYTEPYHFAKGNFTFPPDTQFPCLPVRTHYGLIFPLSNQNLKPQKGSRTDRVYMNGPEIQLARQLGAHIEIIEGKRFHTLPTDDLLFAECAKDLITLRNQFNKKTDPHRNKMVKLINNSIYGKTAQGISRGITTHELYDDDDDYDHYRASKTPYSCISLPHAASAITSMIRATLNICIIEATTLGADVLSATTDGAMLRLQPTSASPKDTIQRFMDNLHSAIAKYPLVQRLLEGRLSIGLTKPLLEVKEYKYGPIDPETEEPRFTTNYGTMAYTWKTRTNYLEYHGEMLNEARTGFTKDTTRTDYVSSQILMDLEGVTIPYVHATLELTTLRDIREGEAQDIVSYRQESALNIAPDWKRNVAADGTSRPWQDMTTYYTIHAIAARLRGAAWPKQVHTASAPEPKPPTMQQDIREITHLIALKAEGFRLPKKMTYQAAATILGVNRKAFARAAKRPRRHSAWTPETPEALDLLQQLGLAQTTA
jgi:hypothetical protein